jgi:hypothetical protein
MVSMVNTAVQYPGRLPAQVRMIIPTALLYRISYRVEPVEYPMAVRTMVLFRPRP